MSSGDDLPTPLLQINNWDAVFEKTKSRYVDKCSWVCVPSKQDSIGLMTVLSEADGAAIYGVWILLVQRCVKQPSPRAGWLTQNGKRDGVRFTIPMLASAFRRPRSEIQRMFMATIDPDVAWITVMEGSLKAFGIRSASLLPLEETSRGHSDATAMVTEEISLDAKSGGGSAVASECQHKGSEGNGRERNGRERKKPLSSEKTDSDPDLIQHAEAKHLISELAPVAFERKVREGDWQNPEKAHWLDEALPLTREDWFVVDWLYRLPADDDAFKRTARVQSFESFLQNLRREIDKARSLRKQLGLNGLHATDEKKIDRDGGWTSGRKQAAFEEFGESITLPANFAQLPGEYQRRIDSRIARTLQTGESRVSSLMKDEISAEIRKKKEAAA